MKQGYLASQREYAMLYPTHNIMSSTANIEGKEIYEEPVHLSVQHIF